jgi:hypothetical protein
VKKDRINRWIMKDHGVVLDAIGHDIARYLAPLSFAEIRMCIIAEKGDRRASEYRSERQPAKRTARVHQVPLQARGDQE